jgi:hypothetical protein
MVDTNSSDTAHVKPLLDIITANTMKFRWPINTDALQEALGNAVVSVIANKQTPEQALRDAEKSYDSMRE